MESCKRCSEIMHLKPVKDHYCSWQCYAVSLEDRWEIMMRVLQKNSQLGFPMGKMANLLYKDFKELEKDGE